MHARSLLPVVVLALCCTSASPRPAVTNMMSQSACANDAEIIVTRGFCASIFADSLGHPRYLAIAPNGDVYVSIEGTRPGQTTPTPAFIALRDTNHDGRADQVERVGQKGNTGIALHGGYLYVDQGEAITRYRMTDGSLVPQTPPVTILAGLPLNPGHR